MKPSLQLYLQAPSATTELFQEFCRLNGYEPAKDGISKMIDDATGIWEYRMQEFDNFVQDCVFDRLPPDESKKDEEL